MRRSIDGSVSITAFFLPANLSAIALFIGESERCINNVMRHQRDPVRTIRNSRREARTTSNL
jgi:hypothetical protein